MGALSGFVMAEILKRCLNTYVSLAPVTSALLYNIGLLLAVHFEAKRPPFRHCQGKYSLREDRSKDQGHRSPANQLDRPHVRWPFTPLYAAVTSIFLTIGASWLRKDTK